VAKGAIGMAHGRIPIRIEWFHHLEGEKTKLNWFLLETALEHYDRIMGSAALAAYREQYGESQIALFCAYYARRMKASLLNNLRGRRKSIVAYLDYIDDYYPNHDHATNRALRAVANEAWEHMLDACLNCPQQCLEDYSSRSMDFDIYKD
jgi:hypothetical protein